jgi:hypothetical protein
VGLSAQELDLAPTYFGLIAGALGFQITISTSILLYYRKELSMIYHKPEEEAPGQQVREAQRVHEGRDDAQESDGNNIATPSLASEEEELGSTNSRASEESEDWQKDVPHELESGVLRFELYTL